MLCSRVVLETNLEKHTAKQMVTPRSSEGYPSSAYGRAT